MVLEISSQERIQRYLQRKNSILVSARRVEHQAIVPEATLTSWLAHCDEETQATHCTSIWLLYCVTPEDGVKTRMRLV